MRRWNTPPADRKTEKTRPSARMSAAAAFLSLGLTAGTAVAAPPIAAPLAPAKAARLAQPFPGPGVDYVELPGAAVAPIYPVTRAGTPWKGASTKNPRERVKVVAPSKATR